MKTTYSLQGLFHRVIGQSGSALAGWAFDKEPEYHARRIASKANCDLPDQEDLIQCLKDIPAINVTLAHKEYRVIYHRNNILPSEILKKCAEKLISF